jgi:hypothetical protein
MRVLGLIPMLRASSSAMKCAPDILAGRPRLCSYDREANVSQTTVTYASPQIAKELTKVFGRSAVALGVKMRPSKDVATFLRRLDSVNKKTAKSSLHFGG